MGFTPASKQTVRDQSREVQEPTQPTEFEVQAYLWSELRALGVNARGEVKTAFAGRAVVRFDIAVFEDGKLTGVLEVKAAPVQHRAGWAATRQGARYAQYSVPIRLVYGMEEAEQVVEDAKRGALWASARIDKYSRGRS